MEISIASQKKLEGTVNLIAGKGGGCLKGGYQTTCKYLKGI
jgi:hypothetical protein